jgi:DNA-binding transcriptional MerR regulator
MNKSEGTKPAIGVFFNEQMWLELLQLESRDEVFEKLIERESFRVADTDLSYRQVNYLDEAGLLAPVREDKAAGWRIFKLRDIVYLHIVTEIKQYGVRNKSLKGIYNAFYASDTVTMNEVILACLLGVEMTLVFRDNGHGFIFNPNFLAAYDNGYMFNDGRKAAEIRMPINTVVNRTLEALKLPPREVVGSVTKAATDSLSNPKLSEIEQKIFDVLRDDNFEQITLKKSGGKPATLYAASTAKSDITEEQLLAEITKQNFSDVEIKKRDGKVVHYRHSKTIKL